jgi:hypothetical protein
MTGWAQRLDTQSIVWHYFQDGMSVCAKHWTDAKPPFVLKVEGYEKMCPRCVVWVTDARSDHTSH